MDRLGRIGVNAADRRELKRPSPCSSRLTTLPSISRTSLFSAALAVQIFSPTQRATMVTRSVEFLIIIILVIGMRMM